MAVPLLHRHLFTLFVDDRGTTLVAPEGVPLVIIPPLEGGTPLRQGWAEVLKEYLPEKAEVQLLLGHGNLNLNCQEVPYLSKRERAEAAQRMLSEGGAGFNLATILDPDPASETGHLLWVASHPLFEMNDWVAGIDGARAQCVFATPWHRAMFRALETSESKSRTRVVLGVEHGLGRLVYLQGHAILLQRAFRMPEGLDPAVAFEPDSLEVLAELMLEELTRTGQFMKQKHRGVVFEELVLLGLCEIPSGFEDRIQRSLRLKLVHLGPNLHQFLLEGARLERSHKDQLNLIPLEIQHARRLRALRALVWASTAAMLVGFIGLGFLLWLQERNLEKEAERAEATLAERQSLAEARNRVVQARFPFLRLRAAEAIQAQSQERLEGIFRTLFLPPAGVHLEEVEVLQIPGDATRFKVSITGSAETDPHLSVGPLAQYLKQLETHPGFHLRPIQELQISDRMKGLGDAATVDRRAISRFRLEGSLP